MPQIALTVQKDIRRLSVSTPMNLKLNIEKLSQVKKLFFCPDRRRYLVFALVPGPTYVQLYYYTAVLNEGRTKLPKSSSWPLLAKWPNHAT